MTKKEVTEKRKCGLKLFDHVVKNFSIEKIVSLALSYMQQHPDVWIPKTEKSLNKWPNAHWAFVNAVLELYQSLPKGNKVRNNGQIDFNLDEALTPEQLEDFKTRANIKWPFERMWERNGNEFDSDENQDYVELSRY